AASSLSPAALLLLLPLLAAAAGGEVSYSSFWRRLDSFRPVADAADGGVSRPTLEAAARLLSADGASLRQAALEALETFVRAEQAAAPFAVASDGNESISACANHTVTLLMALSKGEGWALKFLDSDAKPPAALAYGARLWLGNYDQCMAVGRSDPIEIYGAADEHRGDPLPIRGSYCLLAAAETDGSDRPAGGLESSALRLGLCWPDSCSPAQINNLTQLLLSPLQKLLPANRSLLVLPQATQCHQPRAQLPWTRAAVFMTCLLSLFGVFMLLGTAFDLVRTYRLSWRSLCRSRKQLLVNEDEEADAETASADGISAAAVDGGGHRVNGIANGGHETASSFSAIAADMLLHGLVLVPGQRHAVLHCQPDAVLPAGHQARPRRRGHLRLAARLRHRHGHPQHRQWPGRRLLRHRAGVQRHLHQAVVPGDPLPGRRAVRLSAAPTQGAALAAQQAPGGPAVAGGGRGGPQHRVRPLRCGRRPGQAVAKRRLAVQRRLPAAVGRRRRLGDHRLRHWQRRLGEQSAVAAAVCPAVSAHLLRLPGAPGRDAGLLPEPQAGHGVGQFLRDPRLPGQLRPGLHGRLCGVADV
ncbi:hypothetical protein BOX15_Mlig003401g1, partial [Macrostomum lignano]